MDWSDLNLNLPIVDALVEKAEAFGYREYVQETMRNLEDARFRVACVRAEIEVVGETTELVCELAAATAFMQGVRTRAILLNVPLVRSCVSKLYREMRQPDDLFQTGMVALCRAVDDYIDMGYGFYTYAERCVRNEISWRAQQEKRRHHHNTFSLNPDRLYRRCVNSRTPEDDAARAEELKRIIIANECELTPDEQRILMALYGFAADGCTVTPRLPKEIGAELGITYVRVRCIRTRALRKVRDAIARRYAT